MVGASKILTVSYGTFSCTLEGFDEPFSTMKAIAEYFRDLAADDRYFGATPPTPDAEMLHRIAEREIQRRVEAKISEHGIVLRAEGGAALSRPSVAEHVAPVAEKAPVQHSIPESVAQKLMRIRAVVSETRKAEATQPRPVVEDDEPVSVLSARASEPEPDFGFDLDIGDMPGLKAGHAVPAEPVTEEEPAETAEDTIARAIRDEDDAAAMIEDEAAETESAAAEALDEAAEEALVARAGSGPLDIAEPQDDEAGIVAFEEDFGAETEEPLQAISEMAEESDVEAATAAPEEPAAAVEDDWSDFDDEMAEPEEEPAEAAGQPLDLSAFRAEEEAPETEPADEEAAVAAQDRVIRISRSEEEDFGDEDYDEGDEAEDLAAAFDMAEDQPIEDRTAAVMAALSEGGYDDEFEETAEAGEGDDTAILAQIGAAIGETGLPDDDENDLLRDLAEAARDARRDGHEGRAILESASEDDDASVERLMEEAKSKLEGVESRRRFSAIAHLKAAVAATVADRKMKSGDASALAQGSEPQDDTERYRDDLSKAVRPRRPASDSMPTTQRPTLSTRMAPLVLVSEQRIDMTDDEARSAGAAVRPRRISAAVLDSVDEDDIAEDEDGPLSPEDARSFAEFAERLGATSLPELLEAAAVYTATVEGIEHFSRPQIMKKVAGVSEDEDYSREDSLRSFGMLLRQGKIQKVRRGQFMLAEGSRFRDEAKRSAS